MPILLLIPIAVIAFLYRAHLGAKWLTVYATSLTCVALVVFAFELPPVVFHVIQCLAAIIMLIHVRANPTIPWR